MSVHEKTAAVEDLRASPLSIRLFGPFEVRLHGQPLPRLRSRKGQWLLALLTLRHGCEVERAWLAGILWPDSAEAAAYASLRNSLKDLRQALGAEAGRLRSPTAHTLALDVEGAEADVAAFDEAVSGGSETALERAVSLYRGPLLEGCAEEWAHEERQVREQAYLGALERLATPAVERGDTAAAERYLRLAIAVDPLRESAQRALMRALAVGGSFTAAAQVYQELRRLLYRELNADPDAATQALFQQLRAEARQQAARAADSGRRATGVQRREGETPATPVLTGEPVAEAESPPSGTVTFLFTDIEGSTRLWEAQPEAMRDALVRHDTLLRRAIRSRGGHLFKTMGDQCCAAFPTGPEAVAAALAGQRAMHAEPWRETCLLRVRMALHTGTAEPQNGDYLGPPLNRVARLLSAAHGGQILLSLATAQLVSDPLPEGASLRDLGLRRLQDLSRPEQIYQLVSSDLPSDFPPLRSLEMSPNNLPLQLTSFVGREDQMAEVEDRLTEHRLVTLTGTGGCGKTRMALQVAARLLELFPDGVWFIDLAPLADASLVPRVIAAALGLLEAPGRSTTDTLVNALKGRELLLVLDNCEHLVTACAYLSEALLQSCPRLRILATSREPLRIGGEAPYRVPSLSLPLGERAGSRIPGASEGGLTPDTLAHYEAVVLFVERATTVLPTFRMTSQNAWAVARICHRLDGIPLALELAAALVKVLPLDQLVVRLDDRFRLLTGGSRTALPRQQTLRALMDWSHNLLTEPERALLRRLSVFAGGFSLEAAEVVCGEPASSPDRLTAESSAGPPSLLPTDVLGLLTQLVEKSLVVYEEPAPVCGCPARGLADGEARYRLLETVRQYGDERLLETAEFDAVRDRHRDFFLELAERAGAQLRGSEQLKWLERLDREHDNLRGALEWCGSREGGTEVSLRLAAALWWFWTMRNHFREGRRWVEGALAREKNASPSLRARALAGAIQLTEFDGDLKAAEGLAEECVLLARETGDQWVAAWALMHLANAALERLEFERVTRVGEQSLATARAVGDPWLIAHPLQRLGVAALLQGNLAAATRFFAEGLSRAREAGDRWVTALLLLNHGAVAATVGEYQQAGAFCREAVALYCEVANKQGVVWCLHVLTLASAGQGRAERAARLCGAAAGLREASGCSVPPQLHASSERALEEVRAALGEAAFAAAWAEGRPMALEEAVKFALEESGPDPSRE